VKAADAKALAAAAVPWTELSRLASIPCRKLILLDTCRSGDILDQKAAVRPLKQAECLVFAATSAGGVALEGNQYNNHGAFTASLLKGMAGSADGIPLPVPGRAAVVDGDVSLLELVEFVKNDVAISTGQFQYPTYTPIDLVETLGDTPLVRPQALGGGAN
jgi:hypothetical protein